MFITIPSWDVLVDEFGLDGDGDIGDDDDFQWYAVDDALLSAARTVEIHDTPDSIGDYTIIDSRFRSRTIFKELFAICEIVSNYGTTKTILRRPHVTNRRDR